jgi:hypothetical protein
MTTTTESSVLDKLNAEQEMSLRLEVIHLSQMLEYYAGRNPEMEQITRAQLEKLTAK